MTTLKCDSPRPDDATMLDWLNTQAEKGFVSMAFEMDGGVFVAVEPMGGMGEECRSARDCNTIRDAIAKLMNNDEPNGS